MNQRVKRAMIFGTGLAIGIGLYDYFGYNEFSLSRLLVGGVVGGFAYGILLKLQGR